MKKILGLDLGTNSIGWALLHVNTDNQKQDSCIISAGSRIIPMSQDVLGKFDSGQSVSQTAERTGYRSIRRLRERSLLRRERLHRVLNILGFLPAHYAQQIDFNRHPGQFLQNTEPKLAYTFLPGSHKGTFLFMESFAEMLADFEQHQPQLTENDKKVPYDWTLYYLRKKALTQAISKEELAWLLLHFNQKRGYNQLRGEEEEENNTSLVELYSLKVVAVTATDSKKNQDEIWYDVTLENGWIYRRSSKTPLDWIGKVKDFIVTTELNEDGTVRLAKDGNEKRSFRAPEEKDWTLLKKKTERDILLSNKTVGTYIYDTLLQTPGQKIKGKLVRVVERKFYKQELEAILSKQQQFHEQLKSAELYQACLDELYPRNEAHKLNIGQKDFSHLFINDILFYQRPLKSKKSLISNCSLEFNYCLKEGVKEKLFLKCIAESHPLFQEFRLWQFLHNLRLYEKGKEVDGKLHAEYNVTDQLLPGIAAKTALFDWLNKRKEIDQKTLFKQYFKIKQQEKFRWNYVEDKTYPCNETRATIVSRLDKLEQVPPAFLTREKEEALWHILFSVEDKTELQKALRSFAAKNNLPEDFAEVFKKMPPYDKDYGGYSAKALKKLLPLMRMGSHWNENAIDEHTRQRIERICTAEQDDTIHERVREHTRNWSGIADFQGLPTWLASYIVYNRHTEDSDTTKWEKPGDIRFLPQHSLRNPIVEKVINETLQVVKDIWVQYGKGEENYFSEIHIELGREMKNPADKRERMTKKITENENTNLRIKLLLTELLNRGEIKDIRPYSPMQQEILKLYEEGALDMAAVVPEDILKISKLAQPTGAELKKYILWLQQEYRSPYTGAVIPLSKLFTSAYEIEHIIPQSRYFDDSFSNKVICEAAVNKEKGNSTAYEFIKNNEGRLIPLGFGKEIPVFTLAAFEDFVKNHFKQNPVKQKKLLMEDIPDSFIQRQMNDTRYISKQVKNLLSNIVREKDEQEAVSRNILTSNGAITSVLKQDWGLNDIWNDIITPRFERLNVLTNSKNFGDWTIKEGKRVFQVQVPLELSKGFSKKRIDHRHHALDAIVIACATRNHINYLNNEHVWGKRLSKEEKSKFRYDLRQTLCYKKYPAGDKDHYTWLFKKPWDRFTQDAKETIEKIIVSFKPNLRVINKTNNYYATWIEQPDGLLKKRLKKQEKGENWAIRKPLHKDTVSGLVQLQRRKMVSLSVALDRWEQLTDQLLKKQVRVLVNQQLDKKAIAKKLKELFGETGKDLAKVEIFDWDLDCVASRVFIDTSFDTSKIESITDTGIQKILLAHLHQYHEEKQGKPVEHPELAFSPDGLDEMNKRLPELNGGKPHQPIYKVRTFEPKGNKFTIGNQGNKGCKYVEAAKGTNLFFAIYLDEHGKRMYETIPLNIVIERQKNKLLPVPETNEAGQQLLFYLCPHDLVYVPNPEEEIHPSTLRSATTIESDVQNIYKVVSFTGNQCFFVRNNIATPIVNKLEFSPLNKMEKSVEGIMIKDCCMKLTVNRLGKITAIL